MSFNVEKSFLSFKEWPHHMILALSLMAKFKPATVKVGNSLYGMVRRLPILLSKLPGEPVMVS